MKSLLSKDDMGMKGISMPVVFLVIFTSASLLIATPIFPGSFFKVILNDSLQKYSEFVEALVNGIFYSTIFWLVFIGISKRLEKER